MTKFTDFLRAEGFAGTDNEWPDSVKRFPDGAQCRVEIPSVEGPAVLDAVLAEADARGVPVHRVSQGSGGMLLTSDELRRMAGIGQQRGIEVSLFARPLTGWGSSAAAQASGAGALAAQARGIEQVVHNLEDIERSVEAGIRSVLITDLGVLDIAARLRAAGEFPAGLRFKISVQMGLSNPPAVRLAEKLGADTYNVPTDLTLGQLAAIRAAVDLPLDVYIESPDDQGGLVRHLEIAEIVRVAAPVYLKFGLRNAPNIYPSGTHLEPLAISLGRERVRRAQIGLEFLDRRLPEAVMSKLPADDLAVPA
ncbi:U32 family peptidase [Amycolatopsis taiwanensis]|uniref:U32 family peptidase n=1 Tax=Amycolatopsis taiwanensis TaxID=342230 RepID=UPI00048488E3|nr:U32 family peptidase [Amycolatopsis taiwanensis]